MKKLKLKNKYNKTIVSNYHTCNSEILIVLVHGFTNDKSSNGRFDRLATFLNNKNIDTIAFDFTGSGESDDGALTAQNQQEDLKTVLEFAFSKNYQNIILFGNSFGTLACMRNCSSKITTMILLGAVTDSIIYDWREFFSEDELLQLKTNGYFRLKNDRRHLITQETLNDFGEISQKKLIKDIVCPVLILHGDNEEDLEELELLANSRKAIEYLPKGSELTIIKDAKHGFYDEWNEVIDLSWRWISKFIGNVKI